MIHLLQDLYARYSNTAPDKYRPNGIDREKYYPVVAEKWTKKTITIDKEGKKEIEELSIGVINSSNRLVFFTTQNADVVCQEDQEEKNKKLIGLNQESINKIKELQKETGIRLEKLADMLENNIVSPSKKD